MRRIRFSVWICLSLLASPATAQAAWTPLGALTDPGLNALYPAVAMGTGGDAVFAWTRRDATSDCGGSGCQRIETRVRAADGTLTATQVLSPAGQDARYPAVAVYANGDAILAWELNATIQARVRAADGTLTPIQTLSPPGRLAHSPLVRLDQSGDAVFGWYFMDATTDCAGRGCLRIQARVRAADGSLSGAKTLSVPGEDAIFYGLAVNPAGTAVFVWQRNDGTTGCSAQVGCDRIQARVRAPDGTLSATQTLSAAGESASFPNVAVDATGDAVFGWQRPDGTSGCGGFLGCDRVQARGRSADGSLTATQTLSAPGKNALAPSVTVDGTGNAVFAWALPDATTDCAGSGCKRVQTRTRSAAGVLGATQTVSAPGQHASGGVAGDVNGNAIFSWLRRDGTTDCGGFPGCLRLQARARSTTGVLGATATLSEAGQDARVGGVTVDPDGGLDPNSADGTAVWALRNGGKFCCDILHGAVQIWPPPS
jgi:hypothetical protein